MAPWFRVTVLEGTLLYSYVSPQLVIVVAEPRRRWKGRRSRSIVSMVKFNKYKIEFLNAKPVICKYIVRIAEYIVRKRVASTVSILNTRILVVLQIK